MRMLESIAARLGFIRKSIGMGLLSAMGRNTGGAPRPTVHNMDTYLGRYADQPWVFACINLIQAKAAEVPLKVYKRQGKDLKHLPDHPLQVLLDRANPLQSGYDLREATQGFIELTGNAYWLKDAMVNGKPTELYSLNPRYVRVKTDAKKYVTAYTYEVNGQVIETFAPEEILHFKTWNPLDEFYGMARISAARNSSDSMAFADLFNKSFFENSAEHGGVLSTDQPMDTDAGKAILTSWETNHKGPRKWHKIALLHSGLTFQPTTVTHKDMQFPELKNSSREDVLAVYHVAPVMLGIMDEGNVSKKEQRKIFWQDSMIPRLRKNESVINEFLVKPWGEDLIVAYDLTGIEDLQEDKKARAEEDEILTRSGIKLINEIRTERNLPPVPWGGVWNAPFSLSPITDPREPAPAPGAPTPEPEEDEEDDDEKSSLAALQAAELEVVKARQALASAEAEAASATPPAPEDKGIIRREGLWQLYKSATEARERRWRTTLSGLFNAQERDVKARLRDSWEKRSIQARLDNGATTKATIDVIIFDGSEARKVFRKDGRRLMQATLEQAALDEVSRYSLGAFNLAEPRVQKWLDEKAFKFADEINSTTEEALRGALGEAITAGESVDKVARRIEDVFDMARGFRSKMIARTEVVSASNKGAFSAYEQSGVVQEVEWVTSRDTDVRPSHQIDGQVRGLGQEFENGLQYPGDPSGEADEVINCRCTVAPVVKR